MDSQNTPAPGAARKLYIAVWRWHFYAGLYVIPFLILLSVTGILMVWFSAISPEYGEKISLTPDGTTLSVTAQTEAALAAYPGGAVTAYIAPYAAENPALIKVLAEETSHVLAIHPFTGAVLRDTVEGDTGRNGPTICMASWGFRGQEKPMEISRLRSQPA